MDLPRGQWSHTRETPNEDPRTDPHPPHSYPAVAMLPTLYTPSRWRSYSITAPFPVSTHSHLPRSPHAPRSTPYTLNLTSSTPRPKGACPTAPPVGAYTLNLTSSTSPSCTTYSRPSVRTFPARCASCHDPNPASSSTGITSARTNPLSISV
jgi:hypothetical protein